MTGTRVPGGVGWTALLTAHARVRESLHTDPTPALARLGATTVAIGVSGLSGIG